MDSQSTQSQNTTPAQVSNVDASAVPGVVTPQLSDVQNFEQSEDEKPFYTNWLFYVLVVLLLGLAVFAYFLVTQLLSKQLDLEVQKQGDSANIYVKKLVAPTNGFLVVQSSDNGLPGALIAMTPYLIKDTYMDFNIPIINDGSYPPEFYSQLPTNQKIFITFYKESSGGSVAYDIFADTEIPSDLFGRKLRVVVENGVVQ